MNWLLCQAMESIPTMITMMWHYSQRSEYPNMATTSDYLFSIFLEQHAPMFLPWSTCIYTQYIATNVVSKHTTCNTSHCLIDLMKFIR